MDQHALLQKLQHAFRTTEQHFQQEQQLLVSDWQRLLKNTELLSNVQRYASAYRIPLFQEPLSTVTPVQPAEHPYRIIGVDGSQIFPDRHQGSPWYLIHTAVVDLQYGVQTSSFKRHTHFDIGYKKPREEEGSAADITLHRSVQELATAVEYVTQQQDETIIIAMDGTLSLVTSLQEIDNQYVVHYIQLLLQCAEKNIMLVAYTSAPASSELINLLRIQAEQEGRENTYEYSIDTDILQNSLPGIAATAFFVSSPRPGDILYPAAVETHFCYLHVGYEIVRIELPAYCAQNKQTREYILSVILDQVQKGYGYPVALSEAHEAAVVTEQDRQLFYKMLEQCSVQEKRSLVTSSQKLQKKKLVIV